MLLPPPEPARLAKREAVVRARRALLPADAVLHTADDLLPYECDTVFEFKYHL